MYADSTHYTTQQDRHTHSSKGVARIYETYTRTTHPQTDKTGNTQLLCCNPTKDDKIIEMDQRAEACCRTERQRSHCKGLEKEIEV